MIRNHRQNALFHRFVLLAMLMPFAALSLLADAVMPLRGSDGTLTLVLCTSEGPVETVIDAGADDQKPDHKRCDWAQAHFDVMTADMPDLVVLPDTLQMQTQAQSRDPWRPAFDPRGLFARGPPVQV